MPLILSLETATRAGSVAISHGEVVLTSHAGDALVSHSTHLLDQVRRALDESGVTLQEIDLFAVATGPGSFTGLRIGLATMKSFAATLGRRCVGIPTLDAIAHAAGQSRCTVAALPAGRGELYAQRLSVSNAGELHALDTRRHLAPQTLLDDVAAIRELRWAGEGALAIADLIRARALAEGFEFFEAELGSSISGDEDRWILARNSQALAVSVAQLALEQFRAGNETLSDRLDAIYVRASDAELMNDAKN